MQFCMWYTTYILMLSFSNYNNIQHLYSLFSVLLCQLHSTHSYISTVTYEAVYLFLYVLCKFYVLVFSKRSFLRSVVVIQPKKIAKFASIRLQQLNICNINKISKCQMYKSLNNATFLMFCKNSIFSNWPQIFSISDSGST